MPRQCEQNNSVQLEDNPKIYLDIVTRHSRISAQDTTIEKNIKEVK